MKIYDIQAEEPEGQSKRRKSMRPGPGRPTQQQVLERNRELLDKALDLFVEKGFEGATIADIAVAVGMAKRTVYARYEDKATLFKAVVQRALSQWLISPERLREAESEDLEETLYNVGLMWVNNIMSPLGRKLVRITNAESYRMPEIGLYTTEHGTQPLVIYLVSLFERKIPRENLDLTDLEDAARTFINSIGVLPTFWAGWGIPIEPDVVQTRIRKRVRWFIYGLIPR